MLRSIFLAVSSLLLLLMLILVPFIINGFQKSEAPIGNVTSAVCNTTACKDFAAALMSSINTSVDPCDDFFQFACGGWIAKNPIPASQSSWNTFDVLDQQVSSTISDILNANNDPNDSHPVIQARNFYTACMDTTLLETVGLRPLLDLLSLFGGWPMTLKSWNENFSSWQTATAAITRLYTTGVLLTIYNGLDKKNSSRQRIYIDQGTFILPREELMNASRAIDDISAYTAFITGAAQAIRDAINSTATNSQIDNDVEDMLKFEFALANITTADEDRRDSTRMYNPLSLTQLQNWTDSITTNNSTYTSINWSQLLNDIYYLGAGINIPDNETVVVVETGYLEKLISLLNMTPLRTIANYVHWNLVYQLASTTNQRMKDLQFEFEKATQGLAQPIPLKITCANAANNFLGYAISFKYIASNFDSAAKNETMTMVANLKTVIKALVENATWMDSVTKEVAKEKVNYIVENIGYPDWLTNKTALQNYYISLTISRMDYFGSYQNASKFYNSQAFKNLRGSTDRNFWDMFPDTVNAMYDDNYNAITFPAGIIQLPFFKHGRLPAMNYGGIGTVIGHEITHSLDDEGRQYDKHGNIANWWTNDTLTNYLGKAQCFIDQYGNYTIVGGTHLNGVNTQGENIADNGGVRQAFLAYKLYEEANGVALRLPGLENLTSEQLFFLSWAHNWCGSATPQYIENQILTDVHSPYSFRVNGPLSNNDDFVNQFKCPAESLMNRKNKCTLW